MDMRQSNKKTLAIDRGVIRALRKKPPLRSEVSVASVALAHHGGGSRGPLKPEGFSTFSTTGEAISWGKMSKLENKFFNVHHKKVNK